MASFRTSTLCPCTSGSAYGDCCRAFHEGLREAPTPTALMRSRYSAFALKDLEHLWRTLHPSHPDRQRPRDEVFRDLRASTTGPHFTGLKILDACDATATHSARVLFLARVFLKGKDLSFVERSEFLTEGAAWRYAGGESPPRSDRPLDAWTLSDFRD